MDRMECKTMMKLYANEAKSFPKDEKVIQEKVVLDFIGGIYDVIPSLSETESIRRSNIKRDSRILDLENDLAELKELAERLGLGIVNTFGNRIKP